MSKTTETSNERDKQREEAEREEAEREKMKNKNKTNGKWLASKLKRKIFAQHQFAQRVGCVVQMCCIHAVR